MIRDDIRRMVREAGFRHVYVFNEAHLETFANLVAAAEREAIAKWYEDRGWMLDDGLVPDAIRERGAP